MGTLLNYGVARVVLKVEQVLGILRHLCPPGVELLAGEVNHPHRGCSGGSHPCSYANNGTQRHHYPIATNSARKGSKTGLRANNSIKIKNWDCSGRILPPS
jgi:hypothetical protein